MIEMAYVALGGAAGVFSGLLGIGGGTVVVPCLVYLFGMTQHKAQGTVLAAFLPPVALLAFLKYFQSGHVDLKAAGFVALGIFLGSYVGAWASVSLPELLLKRIFGVFLLFVAAQLMLGK
ncbi:MAG: sulfite exporter TauE/SafE family protein [Candidatus Omnitrophica bacterium]|nr:sulfite exporter TauE/SafE family protein [Candidatus Omnitrophota bacterium]